MNGVDDIGGMRRGPVLRAPEPDDLDAMYLWENDPEVWRVSLNDGPVSRHELWQYIEGYSADLCSQGQLRLIIEADGVAVGTADLTDYSARHRHAQVGLYIAPGARRRGYAAEVLRRMCDYARDVAGLHLLYALTAADNVASAALLRGAGFECCGRIGDFLRLSGENYTDALVYAKVL